MLASYNTQLFGGPLNSGYQTDIHIETAGENTTIEQPDETMFQQYFNPSWDSVNNLFNRILPQLLFLLPTLFIAPIGMILDRRRKRMWMLFFWILPILIIYMQLSWVGKVPIEDMRYFLPILPPTAILTAYVIKQFMKKSKNHTFFIILITSLFLLIGFIMAGYGMNWQLHRRELGPIFQPPTIAILLIISLILLVYTNVIYLKIIEKKKSDRVF